MVPFTDISTNVGHVLYWGIDAYVTGGGGYWAGTLRWPPRRGTLADIDCPTYDFQRRAARLNIAGVPPVDLPLATRPMMRQIDLTPPSVVVPGVRPRWSAKPRRPSRSRRKLRTWERP